MWLQMRMTGWVMGESETLEEVSCPGVSLPDGVELRPASVDGALVTVEKKAERPSSRLLVVSLNSEACGVAG